MKAKEKYRMPNGEWVDNPIKMCRAWNRITEPICKELGVKVIGYDPNILFSYGKYASFNLPIDVAIKIAQLIKNKNKLRREYSRMIV